VQNEFDYLVFSSFMFGRFYGGAAPSPEAMQYEKLFASFTLIKTFPHENYEIRVYQVNR
jgi:hypothetical protein